MRPPVVHRVRPVAFRSFLGGLLLFDPFWSWSQSATAETFMGLVARPQRDDVPVGGLQLDVEPRRGQVYADGWYVGVVDDFSGYYRHLSLGAGSHIIEIVADGHVPVTFEIVISPGRTETYRGALPRAPGRE